MLITSLRILRIFYYMPKHSNKPEFQKLTGIVKSSKNALTAMCLFIIDDDSTFFVSLKAKGNLYHLTQLWSVELVILAFCKIYFFELLNLFVYFLDNSQELF